MVTILRAVQVVMEIILSRIPLHLLLARSMNPNSNGLCVECIQLAKVWHGCMIDDDETRSVIIFLRQLTLDNNAN